MGVYIIYLRLFVFESIYLFINFWLCWVFAAAWAFSSCGEQGLLSSCDVRVSHCVGFCCWGAWALGARASVVEARGLSS